MFTYDSELRLTGINRKGCELIGYGEKELLGKNVLEIGVIHPDDIGKAMLSAERLLKGETVKTELRFVRKDVAILIGEINAASLINQTGKVVLVTNVARDVAEQRRAEERLDKMNRCFLSLSADPLQNIRHIAVAGSEILGELTIRYCRIDNGEFSILITSRESSGFVIPDDPELYICYHAINANRDELIIIEVLEDSDKAKDPDIPQGGYQSFMGYPIRLGDKTVGSIYMFDRESVGFAQEDMHFLGMLARALTIEEERLADKESILHFVDIASHELRTPLSIIKGYADAFQYGDLMQLNEFQMDKIRIINTKADRMTKTINDLLDLSRIERGQFSIDRQDVELEPLVQNAVRQMRDNGFDDIFTISITDALGRRNVDPDKFVDILRILLDNAVSYSPPASEIGIRARNRGEEALLSVLDRGRGIEEKDRCRIFELFYQVEDSRLAPPLVWGWACTSPRR
ncbi:MAG: histidine kinase dimerization/phospho-acceptor domain-containing protein [Actinomycetota bacterium]|nr:histidine kinase dimerization/phospho-acceptor domain-containing protein [Actinomycetota bacterium]